jgi:hypothetical protein
MADHVSSVVLFGLPNDRAMNFLGEPPVAVGPLYQEKAIKVCATDDAVCSDGLDFAAHNTYAQNGSMIEQAANFAASRLGGSGGDGPVAPVEVGTPRPGFGS